MSHAFTSIMPALSRLIGVTLLMTALCPHVTGQEAAAPPQRMYIQEYEVIGVKHLPRLEVEKAVYPFLGPGRTVEDVDKARAALEKAYKDKGYQTVSVQIPRQNASGGIVLLQVVETVVGRLRVHGSRYYDLDKIKQKAPSLAEGSLPNFNNINKDILALNRQADLRVTPALRAGVQPGTVDIDLNVKDKNPLHGSFEVNNRHNNNTTPWRVNGSLRYYNLWQLGHSLGVSYQIAPERPNDARVFSAFYLARIPDVEGVSLLLQGSKQDSDVSTLGGAAVAGRGEVAGMRLLFTLPQKPGFYQSLSFGLDYKHFEQDITVAGTKTSAPVTYFPFSLSHAATWSEAAHSTELNTAVVFSLRGLGTDSSNFNQRRFKADDGFIYYRGDLAHTHKLPGGFEAYGKILGQLSSGPLINNEQLAGGGLATVRGYLESTALGDGGIFGSTELRSPSLLADNGEKSKQWRFYVFADGGRLKLRNALPGQQSTFDLFSIGAGSRFRVMNHFNGSADVGLPLAAQGVTRAGEVLVTLRFWADF
jgi:hemolysin activation/secretion protein